MERNKKWMIISAATGLSFFLIANVTHFFHGSAVIAGVLQLAVNTFVSLVWSRGIAGSRGRMRFMKWCGTIGPVIMAGITIVHVLLPRFLDLFIHN